MNWVLDGAVLLVMIIFTISGVRKGIFKALVELLGAIVSAVMASWVGGLVSTAIYDSFFRKGLYERILSESTGKSGEQTIAALFSELPDFVKKALEMSGITESSLSLSVGNQSTKIADSITDMLSPIFISVINVFVVIILFILFMIIIKAVASLLTGIFKLPVLSQLNSLLGGVFGFIFSAVIIWLAFALINFGSPMLSTAMKKDYDKSVASSYVAKIIIGNNPFEWIFK